VEMTRVKGKVALVKDPEKVAPEKPGRDILFGEKQCNIPKKVCKARVNSRCYAFVPDRRNAFPPLPAKT
jgi:hypothetical protein